MWNRQPQYTSSLQYENLGIDMVKVQTDYMFATGAKMIALAFLGMAASVLVGLMASKVAAATRTRFEKWCV